MLGVAQVGAQAPGTRVHGRVVDALVTLGPLAGAEVIFDGPAGPVIAASDAAGRFVVDALAPGTYRVTFWHALLDVHGLSGAVRTVQVPGDSTLELATPSAADVLRATCPTVSDSTRGVVVGRVTADPDAAPVRGAVVQLRWRTWTVRADGVRGVMDSVVSRTGADGGYQLCIVPRDGTVTWRVASAGALAATTELVLAGSAITPQSVQFSAAGAPRWIGVSGGAATTLATSRVVAAPPALDVTGFSRRRLTTPGGLFLTEADIAARRSIRTTELFSSLPGVNMVSLGGPFGGQKVVMGRDIGARGAEGMPCEPVWFVDGVRLMNPSQFSVGVRGATPQRLTPELAVHPIDQLTSPGDLMGIEIYRGVASVPPQYASKGSECGVIVVWTRRGGAGR